MVLPIISNIHIPYYTTCYVQYNINRLLLYKKYVYTCRYVDCKCVSNISCNTNTYIVVKNINIFFNIMCLMFIILFSEL